MGIVLVGHRHARAVSAPAEVARLARARGRRARGRRSSVDRSDAATGSSSTQRPTTRSPPSWSRSPDQLRAAARSCPRLPGAGIELGLSSTGSSPSGSRRNRAGAAQSDIDHMVASRRRHDAQRSDGHRRCAGCSPTGQFLDTLLVVVIGVHAVEHRAAHRPRARAGSRCRSCCWCSFELLAIALLPPDPHARWFRRATPSSCARVDLRLVWSQFPTAVAPVPSEGSFLLAAALGLGLVSMLPDAFAFRAYGRAEAVVPGRRAVHLHRRSRHRPHCGSRSPPPGSPQHSWWWRCCARCTAAGQRVVARPASTSRRRSLAGDGDVRHGRRARCGDDRTTAARR